jgi:uncharacterized protein Usg
MRNLREEFFDNVHFIRHVAAKQTLRTVKAEILYHMPDHPHLLQTFLYADHADRLVVGESIMKEVRRLEEDQRRLIRPGEENLQDPQQQLMGLMLKLADHMEKLEKTPEEFEIPFRRIPAAKHMSVIEDVPFSGLRRLLTHWHQNLDGPLNSVRVTQCRPVRFGL